MSEDLCLRWEEHHSLFFNAAEQLCQGDFLTDVTLSCGDSYFSAHKLVLSVCSGYFAKLFASRRSPPFTQTIVYLKDVDPKHLELLLRYMYRGEINLDEEDLMDLLHTAKGLQVKGLTEEAEETQSPFITPKAPDGKRKPLVVKSRDGSGPDAKRIKVEDGWTGAQQDSRKAAAGAKVIQQSEKNRGYEEVYPPGYTAKRVEQEDDEEEVQEVSLQDCSSGLVCRFFFFLGTRYWNTQVDGRT